MAPDRIDFDVFLSHKSADKPAVEEIARRLEREGIRCWLDKWNLVPGEPWQEAIEDALGRCATCAVFLGTSGIGPWENEEMRAALERRVTDGRPGGRPRFRVIPVVLPGAPADVDFPTFLRRLTWVRFEHSLDEENAFRSLLSGIRGTAPGYGTEVELTASSPYRGLEAFDVAHAPFFFGREAWVERLLQKLDGGTKRFLALIGPSGSGKSSLARAGVLAALQQGHMQGSADWPQVICRPGAEPLLNLALALSRERTGLDDYHAVRDVARDLAGDPAALHVAVRLALRGHPEGAQLVLLIDQLEELFTHGAPEEERRAFLDGLRHAATTPGSSTVMLVTLRADFYGHLADHPIAELLSEHHTLLGPMTAEELRRAIEEPARKVGCEFEPGLSELLLRDVEGQPGSLPLLQYSLSELWEKRRSRRLTVDAYREIGGVAGALKSRAEQLYGSLSQTEQEICRRLLLLLTQPGEGEGYSRRRTGRDEALASASDRTQAEMVLNKLADARLVVTEAVDGEPLVEIAHEALIREWPRLRGWIDERREELILRAELSEAAERWAGKGRDSSYLFTGARLAAAEERSGEMGLGVLQREFLKASLAFREEEHRRELEQAVALLTSEKRRRRLVLLAAIVAVLAAILGARWFLAQRQVRIQETLARSQSLAARSALAVESFPQRSLLLAREAVQLAEEAGQPHFPPSEEALRRALALSWGYPLQGAGRSSTAISSDRQLLATVSEGGKVRIWNLSHLGTANRPIALFPGPRKKVLTLVISPGNRWLAALDEDNQVYVWDLHRSPTPGKPFRVQLSGPPSGIFHAQGTLAFSPGGEWLATWSLGEPIRLWRLEAPDKVRWIGERGTQISTADFGGDTWLAIGYEGGRMKLWDLRQMTSIPLELPSAKVRGTWRLAFRRAGSGAHWLIASDRAGPTIVWDSSGQLTKPLRLAGCNVCSGVDLSISPRSRWLANRDRNFLYIWDLETPGKPPVLRIPKVSAHVFQSDDTHLAVADPSGVSIWNLTRPIPSPFKAFGPSPDSWSEGAESLAFSPEGDRLVASTGRFIQYFGHSQGITITAWEPAHDGSATGLLGFSPDGKWLITVGYMDVPRLWDVSNFSQSPEPLDLDPAAYFWKEGPGRPWGRGGRWFLGYNALYDLDSFKPRRWGRRMVGPPLLALSPDGEWIAEGGAELRVTKLKDTTPDISSLTYPEAPSALAFNSNASRLAVATSGTIEIRDMKDPKHKMLRRLLQGETTAMTFSSDDRWLAASGKDLRLFDLESPTAEPFELESLGQEDSPLFLFSPLPESWLVIFSKRNATAHLYSLPLGGPRLMKTWNEVTASALSEDGRWLATASRDSISLLDLQNPGATPRTFVGHLGKVVTLAFSPDLQWMASADNEGAIRLWDLTAQGPSTTGIILGKSNFPPAEWLGFHSNWLFTASFNVLRWDLRLSCLKALACRLAGRSLTREEWRSATSIDEPPPDTCSKPIPKEEAMECADVLAPYGS